MADEFVAEGMRAFEKGDAGTAELRAMQALQQAPEHLDALLLLYRCKQAAKASGPAYENLLRRIVRRNPNLLQPSIELAFLLFSRGERVESEEHARNAIRLAPRHPRAHAIMGLVLSDTGRPAAGEYHFRRVIEIEGEYPGVAINLAYCLKTQGKLDEAEIWYRKAIELDPARSEAWIGWSRLEEARRNIPRAWELLREAEAHSGATTDLRLSRAILYGRENRNTEAIETLSQSQAGSGDLSAVALLERGRLYEKMERYDEAWDDFERGKRLCREVQGLRYNEPLAANLAAQLAQFFVRSRMTLIPHAARDETVPQPIFIVGFPRSGTTMVEQILSAHPQIAAGDELPFVNDLVRIAPRWLGSPHPYPNCLADLWMGDNRLIADRFRDYYLRSSQQLGVWEPGVRFFTDKMPLNETHLGLIHILFPNSPIVHVRRHPLDSLVSNFSNFLTHGFNQAFDVKTCAAHYVLIDNLVEHYKRELDLNYLEIRYEDLISDQEQQVKRLLGFIGVDFDPRCMAFHDNQRYARTASYAQVTEKLYDTSVNRHRNFSKHLEVAATILQPCLDRLGYSC
jgi:tetratricopeptide (TPR) repeat protein